jgi:hypothetical protein
VVNIPIVTTRPFSLPCYLQGSENDRVVTIGKHSRLNRQIWYRHLNSETGNDEIQMFTIFRKAPPSVVSGYGKRSINLNKVVANFEKHIFLSQTDLTRTGIIK